ncbi:MAG: FlgD immunoglobulin-like domain containing protein, partial [Pseudoxanthomonas sp.]
MSTRSWPHRPALAQLVLAIALAGATFTVGAVRHDEPGDKTLRLPDHFEFDATLDVAFRPDAAGAHAMRLAFDYPAGGDATLATWQVDVLAPNGKVVRRWIGEAPLADGRGAVRLTWDGKDARGALAPSGFYTARLRSVPSVRMANEQNLTVAQRAVRSFAL